jgi:GTP cyclohydrolase I
MNVINENAESNNVNGYMRIDSYDDRKTAEIASIYKQVLTVLGEDPEREGLLLTPERVAKSLQFLTQGYLVNPDEIIRSAMFEEEYKEMVIVKDIDIFSLCEHHMIPFIGKAHVAYIPDRFITGLSKIARVVEIFARRLQVQQNLNPLGVAVVIEAKHMCMVMRGIQKQNSVTTTSAFTGDFLNNISTREEFIHLIGSRLI